MHHATEKSERPTFAEILLSHKHLLIRSVSYCKTKMQVLITNQCMKIKKEYRYSRAVQRYPSINHSITKFVYGENHQGSPIRLH